MKPAFLKPLVALLAFGGIVAAGYSIAQEATKLPTAAEKFQNKLQEMKPKLDEMSPEEQDRAVEKLQTEIVPVPGWWESRLKEPENADKILERQNAYLSRLEQRNAELRKMPRDKQVEEMERIKREIFEEPQEPTDKP